METLRHRQPADASREALRSGAAAGGGAFATPAAGSREGPAAQTSLITPKAVEQTLLPASVDFSAANSEAAGEQRWIGVFRSLQEDGEVHRDRLLLATRMAGFLRSEAEAVESALAGGGLTRYNTLDRGEFVRFLRKYEAQELHAFEEAFRRQGMDLDGMIPMQEISSMLKSRKIALLDSVVWEAAREVDRRGTQRFSWGDTKRVLEILSSRHGLPRHEFERFRCMFVKLDADKTGLVDAHKLQEVLGWLGHHSLGEQQVAEIISEATTSTGRNLNKYTFLVCMRKVYEFELALIQTCVEKFDAEYTSSADLQRDVVVFLRSLGCTPDREAVVDAAEAVGIVLNAKPSKLGRRRSLRPQPSVSQHFDPPGFSELLHLLEVYRDREGLSLAEVKEVETTFQRYDHDASGAISALHVGKVLRWLGLPTTWEVQRQLVSEVDIDSSGQLTLAELKKVLRKYREQEDLKTKLAFEEHDLEATGVLSLQQCRAALVALGYSSQLASMDDCKGSKSSAASADTAPEEAGDHTIFAHLAPHAISESTQGIDVHGFIDIAARLRRQARLLFRNNAGYSAEEAEDLGKVFAEYDADGSGDISHGELRALLEDLFPDFATSAERRQDLLRLLAEIDADGNGRLDFPDFLRLMRQFHDLEEQDQAPKEESAVIHTKFTREEVDQFQELFNREARRGADGKDRLLFGAFADMIGGICPLHEKHLNELYVTFSKVAGSKDSVETPSVEFPGFLTLMRHLLDSDFANLDENAKKVARQKG